MRIVLCYPVEPHHIQRIQAAAPAAEIVNAGQENVDVELPSADIFIGHAKVPVDWGRVVRGGRLKWIQSSAAGLDHCLVPEVLPTDIVVTSAAGLFAPQVTEQTLALLLGLLREIPLFLEAAKRREFIRRPTDDLRGKTVGIVGLGGNGRCIARALAPLDVRIVATDYYPVDKPAEVDQLWGAEELPKLMQISDIVILALPLNQATRGIIDGEKLSMMRPGGYLINVARGQVVLEADLVAALQTEQLKGAGLDVTEVEPLPPESPLWEMPRVIITPHVGAQSSRRVDDTTDLVCENLERYLRGEDLWNRVDKGLGFAHPSVVWKPHR